MQSMARNNSSRNFNRGQRDALKYTIPHQTTPGHSLTTPPTFSTQFPPLARLLATQRAKTFSLSSSLSAPTVSSIFEREGIDRLLLLRSVRHSNVASSSERSGDFEKEVRLLRARDAGVGWKGSHVDVEGNGAGEWVSCVGSRAYIAATRVAIKCQAVEETRGFE